MDAAVAYSIASGKLYCEIGVLQDELSRLTGYPVMTHEMADENMWKLARAKLEREFMEAWFPETAS